LGADSENQKIVVAASKADLLAALCRTQNRTRQYLELPVKNGEWVLDSHAGQHLHLQKPGYVSAILATLSNYLKMADCKWTYVIEREEHSTGCGSDPDSAV
jgi:hypothetical protein